MTDVDEAGAAYRCDFCGDWPDWQMLRVGDAAITWACDEHTAWTLDRFQRVDEQTKVIVTRCMHRAYYEGQQRSAGGEGRLAEVEAERDQPAESPHEFTPSAVAKDGECYFELGPVTRCGRYQDHPVHSGEGDR